MNASLGQATEWLSVSHSVARVGRARIAARGAGAVEGHRPPARSPRNRRAGTSIRYPTCPAPDPADDRPEARRPTTHGMKARPDEVRFGTQPPAVGAQAEAWPRCRDGTSVSQDECICALVLFVPALASSAHRAPAPGAFAYSPGFTAGPLTPHVRYVSIRMRARAGGAAHPGPAPRPVPEPPSRGRRTSAAANPPAATSRATQITIAARNPAENATGSV
jgi:hypothetical protein